MSAFFSIGGEKLADAKLQKTEADKPSAMVDPRALIAQLKLIQDSPSVLVGLEDDQRRELKRLARSAADALEQPFETMVRLAYSPLLLVAARIGQDHGIFAELCATERLVSLTELSERSRIPPDTLEPIMDSLCARGMARQVETRRFAATRFTHFLSSPELRSAYTHYHDAILPGFMKLNAFLHDTQGPRTAFQMGQDTDLGFYDWLEFHPVEKEAFHHYMESHVIGLPIWLDVLEFDRDLAAGARAEDVVFVDVGGSVGHQCETLLKRYPGLVGRVIVQDRPEVVERALAVEGMEKMAYDYLTEQPIKGSRVLYFRQILHNNDDETCKKILQAQLPAMDSNTVLVIDDKVLPDQSPSLEAASSEYQASLSLVMRTLFNSQERREVHWRELVTEAGLVVKDIRKYTDFDDSVILCVKMG